MSVKNADFLKKLLATFRIEADEHVAAMSAELIEMEKTPAGDQWSAVVEKIYREAHSLKGAARAVNHTEIESVCQSLESVFAVMKDTNIAASLPLFDLLHQATATLGTLLAAGANEKPPIAMLVRRLEAAVKELVPAPEEPSPDLSPVPPIESTAVAGVRPLLPASSLISETVRVATAKLDSVMRQAEELLAPRLSAGQRVIELRETVAALAVLKKERAKIRPVLRSVERSLGQPEKINGTTKGKPELTKLLDYLEAEKLTLEAVEGRLARLERSTEHDHRALTGMVDGLLHDVREMHMLPFSSLLEAFPRVARELARDQDKQVELAMRGGDIEIDRRILEAMKDPLNHLLRNCIDHGIEKPDVRAQQGKPAHGMLTIAVSHQDSSKVEILVTDDGAGIDVVKVKEAAIRLGIVPAGKLEQFDEREVLPLIFQSGLTTSRMITDLSGRGLGLAIVRERVERLGGTITIETHADRGTTFRIVLPLTLATFRGVLVRAGDQDFIIPAISVERVVSVANKDIQTVENRETILLDGLAVSLVRLDDVLEMPRKSTVGEAADNVPAVVLGAGVDRVAFQVDAVIAEQEVLVKGLGRQLARVRNVAGASVLGTGQVVPVLNVPDLMKSALKSSIAQLAPATAKPARAEKRSILVVEDSITSRALLKNILESAGFHVTTAVDGIDAYTTLKTGTFDLIVSDVEMPRMDGFDLTAKVRSDKRLSELPVVLVTALESREHRERGIDVGANAYIVKSSFDQSNLLEVVGRLI